MFLYKKPFSSLWFIVILGLIPPMLALSYSLYVKKKSHRLKQECIARKKREALTVFREEKRQKFAKALEENRGRRALQTIEALSCLTHVQEQAKIHLSHDKANPKWLEESKFLLQNRPIFKELQRTPEEGYQEVVVTLQKPIEIDHRDLKDLLQILQEGDPLVSVIDLHLQKTKRFSDQERLTLLFTLKIYEPLPEPSHDP